MMTPMAGPYSPSEQLLGSVVRERIAELGMTLPQVAEMTGIPARTLQNTTRQVRPDRMARYRAVRLARALHLSVATITAGEGVPDEPPQQPKNPPGPARRQETEQKKTGPKREQPSGRVA